MANCGLALARPQQPLLQSGQCQAQAGHDTWFGPVAAGSWSGRMACARKQDAHLPRMRCPTTSAHCAWQPCALADLAKHSPVLRNSQFTNVPRCRFSAIRFSYLPRAPAGKPCRLHKNPLCGPTRRWLDVTLRTSVRARFASGNADGGCGMREATGIMIPSSWTASRIHRLLQQTFSSPANQPLVRGHPRSKEHDHKHRNRKDTQCQPRPGGTCTKAFKYRNHTRKTHGWPPTAGWGTAAPRPPVRPVERIAMYGWTPPRAL